MKKYKLFICTIFIVAACQTSFGQSEQLRPLRWAVQWGVNMDSSVITELSSKEKYSGTGFGIAVLYRFPFNNTLGLTTGVNIRYTLLKSGDKTIETGGGYLPVMLSYSINHRGNCQLIPSVGFNFGGGAGGVDFQPVIEAAVEYRRLQFGAQYAHGLLKQDYGSSYNIPQAMEGKHKNISLFIRMFFN